MKGGAANRSTVITAKQVQYLQTIRRQMGIDDELYEEMKAAIGAKSTRELTNAQFDQLLARLRGRKGKSPGKARSAAYKPVHPSAYASGMHLRPPEDVAGMISKIEAILTELKLPWSYVDGMARKMCGVDKLRWCDAAQVYTILQALCVYQRRRRARESGGQETAQRAKDVAFYFTELRGEQCRCEKPKKAGFSFCFACYKRLPEELRRSLYRKIGKGYEEAYEEACRFLDDEEEMAE